MGSFIVVTWDTYADGKLVRLPISPMVETESEANEAVELFRKNPRDIADLIAIQFGVSTPIVFGKDFTICVLNLKDVSVRSLNVSNG